MIFFETDAPDLVLGALVRDHCQGAAQKAGLGRRGWSEVRLVDSWPLADVEAMRAELVSAGYRVFIEMTPGPI